MKAETEKRVHRFYCDCCGLRVPQRGTKRIDGERLCPECQDRRKEAFNLLAEAREYVPSTVPLARRIDQTLCRV